MDYNNKITTHVSNIAVQEPLKNIDSEDLILKQLNDYLEKFSEKDNTPYIEQPICSGKLTTIDSIIQI